MAYTDQLTGLRNRRFLMERLAEEVDKAQRHNLPLSCLIMDVDNISPVDADSGAVSVDDLLAEVAMTLRTYTRTYDVLSRYDGTMFAVLLPHTPLSDATEYASKILNEVDATIYSDPNMPTKASMSVGIVTCSNGGSSDAEEIFGEAMRTLLKAKSMSGERIATCDLKA
ncbi:MAG: GGDEF domain-containing protein [Candidatus Hydrogenedentes bacterium]|nr:GGDEF domain-containing protein [Candidatus Hydrogenedentota bacterium]